MFPIHHVYVCGLWVEARQPTENPYRHRKKRKAPGLGIEHRTFLLRGNSTKLQYPDATPCWICRNHSFIYVLDITCKSWMKRLQWRSSFQSPSSGHGQHICVHTAMFFIQPWECVFNECELALKDPKLKSRKDIRSPLKVKVINLSAWIKRSKVSA